MADDTELSISLSLERLALALGEAGAVPRGDLVRALERVAERLRTGPAKTEAPTDVYSAGRGRALCRREPSGGEPMGQGKAFYVRTRLPPTDGNLLAGHRWYPGRRSRLLPTDGVPNLSRWPSGRS